MNVNAQWFARAHLLDRDEAARLAKHSAVGIREVHQDAIREEHEPVMPQLRTTTTLTSILFFQQPAVCDVCDFLLQHYNLLKPQMPLGKLSLGGSFDLEGLVSSFNFEYLIRALGAKAQ